MTETDYYAEPKCPSYPSWDTGLWDDTPEAAWERGWEAGKAAGIEWMRRLEMG